MSTGAIYNGMGQGDVLVTPIQLANYVAAIANKGWYYTPHIVKSIDGKPNPDPRFKVKHQTLVDKKHFEPVLKGMEAVVLRGTAED
jgi:penicillin-binding protein 2